MSILFYDIVFIQSDDMFSAHIRVMQIPRFHKPMQR